MAVFRLNQMANLWRISAKELRFFYFGDSVFIICSHKSGKFSYISKFHIIISCKLIVYIVMCFYQETN